MLVLLGGVDHQPAGAAPRETPARKITRLRAKAARVRAAIDRMHTRVEVLVEDYNEVHEALARTRAEQARTRRQVLDARRRLQVARRVLGKRLWTIYTGGAPSTLGQLLAADSVHQALATTKYQEQVVGADRAAIDQVERLRRQVEALAAELAGQAERLERLRTRLVAKRRQIESRLDAQRHYLKRLTRQVRRAVLEERRRQERLRRLVLLRRLAAERAARARAAAAGRAGSWGRFGGAGAPSGAAGRAVAFARSQLGKPYVWGASGPSSYDCSGLIMAAYRSAGVWLPRVSRAQFSAGPRVGLGSLAPGDLVFFAYNPATRGPSTTSACTSAGAPWSRPPIPGPASASPPSAAATTSAPSVRPADRLGAVGKDSSC